MRSAWGSTGTSGEAPDCVAESNDSPMRPVSEDFLNDQRRYSWPTAALPTIDVASDHHSAETDRQPAPLGARYRRGAATPQVSELCPYQRARRSDE